MQGMHKQLKC